ncbi:MAG: hypothetical protein D6768_00725, partial [Chloroflexi bacterium]
MTQIRKIVLLLLVVLVLPQPALAQDPIQVDENTWDGNFRDYLTFSLEAHSSAEITDVDLFYRIVGQIATSRNKAKFTPGNTVSAQFTIDQTEPGNYMPPGTDVEYWWKITDADGNELKTEKQTLTFLDNRHNWQTRQNDRLTLYWYEGGDSFGDALFERANEALDTLETDIGISLENPIKIFIYANHNDLLQAISTGAQEWTGGQAFAEHGVVVIGVSPSQLDWGLGAMTHEMTHLVIHQATDNPFSDLPRWLDEGIAVYNENQEELDDDFKPVFDRAVANDKLMTLRTLSSPFPADPMEANLAYGQSGAVVKFIVDTYGSEAMANLLNIFADGALYDEALEQALKTNTDGLDNAFRESLGLPPLPGAEPAATEPAATEPAAEAESGESQPEAQPESADAAPAES